MNRIYNTLFNNIAGDMSNGEKVQLVQDGIVSARGVTNSIVNMGEDMVYTLTVDRLAYCLAFTAFPYATISFIPRNRAGQTFLLGVDSLEFAKTIVSLFGLSNNAPGVTNVGKLDFINQIPVIANLVLGSISSTFEYVSFTQTSGPTTSNSLILYPPSAKGTVVEVIITATFDIYGNLTKVDFSV